MTKERALQKKSKPTGQALTEFALIISVVLLMIFVLIESGRIMWGWVTVQEAAREGARYAITGQFEPEFVGGPEDARVASILAVMMNRLSNLPLDHNAAYGEDFHYSIRLYGIDDGGCLRPRQYTDSNCGPENEEYFAGAAGEYVVVQVTYFVPIITPFLRPLVETVPVFGQVTLINERWGQLGGFSQGVGLPPSLPALPTPGPSPTPPPPPPCFVDILPSWIASEATEVIISGDIDTVVNLYQYDPITQVSNLIAGPLTLTISNIGSCPAAALFSWPEGTLSPNNILLAESSDGSIDTAQIYSLLNPVADLAVSQTSSPNPVNVGEELVYRIEVSNNGPAAALGVVLTNTLPVELTYTSADSPPNTLCFAQNSQTIICNLGTLLIGETAIVEIRGVVNPIAAYRLLIYNTATVNGTRPDPDLQNNTAIEVTEIIASQNTVDLSVSKTASAASINLGDPLTYEIVVTNLGPMEAENVTAYDSLPFNFTVNTITSSHGSCQRLPDAPQPQAIICLLGNLDDGESATITLVGEPGAAGLITNIVRVWSSSQELNLLNNRAEVGVQVITDDPYITVFPACGNPGDIVVVNGYNWPTGSNRNVELRWNTAGGTLLETVVNNPVEWSRTIQIPLDALMEVNHTILARRTHGATVTTAEFTFPVPCILPDLIVEELTLISPEPIFEGEPATFAVTISNQGRLAVNELFRVSLYLDPPTPGAGDTHISSAYRRASTFINSPIEVNDSLTFTMTIQTGITGLIPHTVYAVVDSDPPPFGEILEVNEANNISAPAQIRPPVVPDLIIGPLELLTTDAISTGMPIQFQATITNTGELDVNNQFFVALYADPDPAPILGEATFIPNEFRVGLAAVNGLPGGASQTVLIIANFPSSDTSGLTTKQVYGVVDAEPAPTGLIVEGIETNNISLPLAVELFDLGDATPPPDPGTGRLLGITYVWLNGSMNPQYQVEVQARRTDPPPITLAGTAFSNVSGIYSINDLMAGNYVVTACTLINNVSYTGSNTTAVVNEGQTTIINLYLFPGACPH